MLGVEMLRDHLFIDLQMLDAAIARRRIHDDRNASTSSVRAL